MYAPVCAVHGAPLYISSRLYPAADVRDAAPGGATARTQQRQATHEVIHT